VKTLITRAAAAASALILSSALAASAADAPAPTVALTPPSGSPVRLNSVWIHKARGQGIEPGIIAVSFTNLAPATATNVSFNVLGFGKRVMDTISDAGTFTTGAVVQHEFPANEIDGQQTLEVEEVDFADGSVWTKPMPPAPVTRRQAIF
jgi:hypothetical protein